MRGLFLEGMAVFGILFLAMCVLSIKNKHTSVILTDIGLAIILILSVGKLDKTQAMSIATVLLSTFTVLLTVWLFKKMLIYLFEWADTIEREAS